MKDIDINSPEADSNAIKERAPSLGWLKLYILGPDAPPSSRTIYISRNKKIYAVLHTDITGGTKAINLPADRITGSEYTCTLDNGDHSLIKIYPYVVNVHYIDKTKEKK